MGINYYNPYVRQELYIMHHGIAGQKWGKRNGPPYPLTSSTMSYSEKRNSKDSGESWSEEKKVSVGKKLLNDTLKHVNVPSKLEHFNRNDNMPFEKLPKSIEDCLKLGWNGNTSSVCHQFTSKAKTNRKFVSPDGKLEAIFNSAGKIVTSPEDRGSFNLASPINDPLGHFVKDVMPWIAYGNSPDDSTSVAQRLKAFSVDGGISVIKNKVRFNK